MKKNVTVVVRRPGGIAPPEGSGAGLAVDYATGVAQVQGADGWQIEDGSDVVYAGRALLTPPRFPRAGAGRLTPEGEPETDGEALLILPGSAKAIPGDDVTVTARGYAQRGVVVGVDLATGFATLSLDATSLVPAPELEVTP